MRKLTRSFYLFFISLSIFAQQNRMWVPSDAQKAYYQMMEKGARFSLDDLYHPEKPSFNDAIVQFNGGCTAEIISPQGLILTNHHCGYGIIQSLSSLEHNYVEDGFWAGSYEEELPAPGAYVTFVRRIVNVTQQVLQGVSDDMSPERRQSVVDKNIAKLKQEIQTEPWQYVEIKPYLYGNIYYALVKEDYKDIRLVGAPPSSVGKFGADTDNWMWPRHSGDFSLFRIYAAPDNRPAEYSPDNVPYRPEKYFKVSLDGVKEGDLILVYGFPGRTQQYLPSFAVEHVTQTLNPVRIDIRQRALDIMDKYMRSNDTLKLKYTSTYARVANYWKKWKGENLGIKKSNAIENKRYIEKLFLQQAGTNGFGEEAGRVLEALKQAYNELEAPDLARNIFIETMYVNNDWMRRAFLIYQWENLHGDNYAQRKAKILDRIRSAFNRTDNRVSKELFIRMMAYYKQKMPEAYKNKTLFEKNIILWADEIEKTSLLADSSKINRLALMDYKKFQEALKNDSGYNLARTLIDDYYGKIAPEQSRVKEKINNLMRVYTKLLMQSGLYKDMVPDANSTLRLSFGEVRGYEPRDGVYYEPVSTLDGVMEKYIPGDYEFDLPEQLLKLYEQKDFGNYETGGTVPVNFLGTAHTTGGNSGSPAINAKGELVGINFDRVWEGTMSDLFYDPKICRNIMVDMRYVMFVIDKLGKAQNLVNEIIQNQ